MNFCKKYFIILFSVFILLFTLILLIAVESDFDNLKNARNIAAYEGLIINDIEVTGEVRLTETQIKNSFPIKAGSKFSRAEINEAIKKLNNYADLDFPNSGIKFNSEGEAILNK